MRLTDFVTEKCWKGYTKKGMKTMFGKRVPNCVKKESADAVSLDEHGNLVFEDGVSEDLKKWFKEKWVRFGPDGKIRGDCARGSSKEGKPKCLPQAKAQALGKKGRSSSAAKKRREDPNPERKGKAKNVATKTRSMKEALPPTHDAPAEKQPINPIGVIRQGKKVYDMVKGGKVKDTAKQTVIDIIKNATRDDASSRNRLPQIPKSNN